MVVVLFGTLVGLMIGTGELSLVGLPFVLTLEYPLESTNNGVDMPGTLLSAYLWQWFGSKGVSFWCSWCRHMYCRKAT